MPGKAKVVRKMADMLNRVAGDYTNPAALYRAVREVHPKGSKKQVALAALAALIVGAAKSGEPKSTKAQGTPGE